jgi:uncharacterized membrane protein
MDEEKLTLDNEVDVSMLLSEYLHLLERLPIIKEEYNKRRNIIEKYQRYVSDQLDEDNEGK